MSFTATRSFCVRLRTLSGILVTLVAFVATFPNVARGEPDPVQTRANVTKDQKLREAVSEALHRIDAQLPLRAADETALKKAAEKRKVSALAVCGDPGNMPLSNKKQEGYQNKIIELVAESMGARVNYFWRPYLERGLTRQTFDSNDCEILLDVPADYDFALTTEPVYKTTYVFASRADRNIKIKDFDDPILKKLKIGVFQTSGIRIALTRHGIRENVYLHLLSHDADLDPEKQPWRQVQKVLDGELDVAGIWGPFAGWVKTTKGAPLTLQPVNLMDDETPLEFAVSLGLRRSDVILKYKLELALEEKKTEIEEILRAYGVPLVECSKCYVQGDLPAHGIYQKPRPVFEEDVDRSKMSADQRVTKERVEDWLAHGADINSELANAVLGEDVERVKFLAEKGADVNGFDNQGYAPVHTAARHRNEKMLAALIDLGADPDQRDSDGFTPLLHSVLRDHVPAIELLSAKGVDLDGRAKTMGKATPLAVAIAEHKLAAAMALIRLGAAVNTANGELALTPLMIASGKELRFMTLGAGVHRVRRYDYDPKYPKTLEVVRALLKNGADVNARNRDGVTALMLAAAHNSTPIVGLLLQLGANADTKSNEGKTASDIAKENGNDAVVNLIRLISQSAKKNHNPVIR